MDQREQYLRLWLVGIKPIVLNPGNVRTMSYVTELEKSGLDPISFINQNYSHYKFARELLRGI
jgi:hypothetical protein